MKRDASHLVILGAHEHNLKHVDLSLPHNTLIGITGPSGSGKSSLVQDTLFTESQRLYFESLSLYSKSYMRIQSPAKVKRISYLRPSISIDQKTRIGSKRSTVGTVSEVLDYLRLLYARFGASGIDQQALSIRNLPAFVSQLSGQSKRTEIGVLLEEQKKGTFHIVFQKLLKLGFVYVWVDGEQLTLTSDLSLDARKKHRVAVMIDRVNPDHGISDQKLKGYETHLQTLQGRALLCRTGNAETAFAKQDRYYEPHHFSFNNPFGRCPTCEGVGDETCQTCQGSRIHPTYGQVSYHGIAFKEASSAILSDVYEMFGKKIGGSDVEQVMLSQLVGKLSVLNKLGLGYLPMCRSADTLSGGETQRLRIGSQINQTTSGMLYLFDEPSIGLHPQNTHALVAQLKALAQNNTVIVIEHDISFLKTTSYLVELGPGGGLHGGTVVYSGTTDRFVKRKSVKNSKTHAYFKMEGPRIDIPESSSEKSVTLSDISKRNVQISKLTLPLEKLVVFSGVSGSGKSTLLFEIVLPELQKRDHNVYWVTQDPIGKSSRSAVVTYFEIYQLIRALFAASPSSRIRGLTARDFSFNTSPFRCPQCLGTGMERFELNFLPQAKMPCQICHGRRFTDFLLRVRYKDKTISEVLDLTVEEAATFFQPYPKIFSPLRLCLDLGLGYLTLGQPTSTLSGGEAQRVKLIYELSKRKAQGHIYCLDEPTTGLSSYDIQFLLKLFARLIAHGNSVFVIEHQTDVISQAQHIVELGPGGGPEGGELISQGTPDGIRKNKKSLISKYL